MKNYIIIALLLIAVSCEDYVTNIEKPVNYIHDDELNSESQLEFLIPGVELAFSWTVDRLCLMGDILSDQFIHSTDISGQGILTIANIDDGEIKFDNSEVGYVFYCVSQLRFLADDLVRRVENMDVSNDSIKNHPLFIGYLYAGIARYFYATYIGLNPNEGGGVIDVGQFIPSSEMYELAIEKFKLALQKTNNDYEVRLVNSLIARTYLYNNDFSNAADYAEKGLTNVDAPFEALYGYPCYNTYYEYSGGVDLAGLVDPRFRDYIKADSMEAARIQLAEAIGNSGTFYYYQQKYPENDSPLPYITWQENNLMRAELALRGAGNGDALQLVNEVRNSHGLSNLTSVDLDVIYEERDKELFCTGARLPDQRRFNRWHLGPGTWQYLPISQRERDLNPNIN